MEKARSNSGDLLGVRILLPLLSLSERYQIYGDLESKLDHTRATRVFWRVRLWVHTNHVELTESGKNEDKVSSG